MYRSIAVITAILLTHVLIAQSDKSSKIKTQFLQVPGYDVSSVDPSTVTAEFGHGTHAFGQEKLKDTKATCVPKGGSLKDAVQLTTYYYEVPINIPASYLIAKDGDGNIVYGASVSKASFSTVNFGYQECNYWQAEKVKKEWPGKKAGFERSETSKSESNLYQKARNIANNTIYASYLEDEFQLYTAKGKGFDYSDLDKAFSMAEEAYEKIADDGPNGESFDKLRSAIEIWEKELETADIENKKARINKSIAKGLHQNISIAHMYLYEMDEAIKSAGKMKDLFGNFSNNRTMAMDERVKRMLNYQVACNANESLVKDPNQLAKLAESVGSGSVSVAKLSGDDFARLEKEYSKYRLEHFEAQADAADKMEQDAIAAGEANPYDKYVTDNASGKILMMTNLAIPPAPKIEELPAEMCKITDLDQIIITGNNITKIAPEIGNLTQLKKLNLANNPITEVPEEIKNCSSLKTLNLKGSKLSAEQQKQITAWLPNTKVKF